MVQLICCFSTATANTSSNHERERGPNMPVGLSPTDTLGQQLTTLDDHDQITMAT